MSESSPYRLERFLNVLDGLYLGVCLFAIPMLLLSDTIDPALPPRFLLWSITLSLVLFGRVVRTCTVYAENRAANENGIVIVLVCYLFISVLSAVGHSVIVRSAFDLLKVALFVVHVSVCVQIFRKYRWAVDFAVRLVCLCCLSISSIGLLQYYQVLPFTLPGDMIHLPYSTMTNKNLFASLLFLMVPFVFYGLKSNGTWPIVHGITLGLATMNIILSQTRAVYLATAISLVCVLLWTYVFRNPGKKLRKDLPGAYKIGFLIVGFSAIIGLLNQTVFYQNATIMETAASIGDLRDVSIHQRLTMWRSSLQMTQEHPLLGVGIGNWQIEFPKYGLSEMAGRVQQGEVHFQRPHNDFLWVLSETGMPGFLSYCAIFFLAVWSCMKIIARAASQQERFLAVVLAFQTIGFTVISFFDFPKERIEHLVYFGVVLSMICSLAESHGVMYLKTSEWWRRITVPPLFAAVLLSVFIGWSRVRSEISEREVLRDRSAQNWSGVIDNVEKARTPFFVLDPMSTPLMWYSGVAYFSLNDIKTAYQRFLEAYHIHPNHLHVLNNLATCEQLLGHPHEAITLYQKALSISPAFEPSLRNLGAVYYDTGQYEDALRIIQRCNPIDSLAMQYLEVIKLRMKRQR